MKRFPAFDPPEYVAWERDEEAVREYGNACARDRSRAEVIARLGEAALVDIYRGLLRNRLTDIALKRMVRQGVISKAWLGTGEEAATIGPVHALRRPGATGNAGGASYSGDYVAPMIRNSGACHEMGMPIADILRAYMATYDGPTKGRDGHYGSMAHGVLPPISHVGDGVPVVVGIALSFAHRVGAASTDAVALTWIGDGSTKAGAAHEGLNFAAVRKAPAIFIIQNNQVALGTRLEQHHLAAADGKFADWPRAYGMWGGVFDGNNVLDAYALTALAVERCRRGAGPALLVAETFRMGGHATHDEAEARRTFDGHLFSTWGRRDPIAMYEEYLVGRGLSRDALGAVERAVEEEVDRAQEVALESRRERMPPPDSAVEGVYASRNAGTGERPLEEPK